MRSVHAWVLATLALLPSLGTACSDEGTPEHSAPLLVATGCQVLLADVIKDAKSRGPCLLPYPSDFFREPDVASSTGARIRLHGDAAPRTTKGALADPHEAIAYDGASTVPTIVATLGVEVTAKGLPQVLDPPEKSASAASPTVLIEADTGAFVSHYVDVPERRSDARHAAIVIRPLAPLRPRTRYIVALRRLEVAPGAADPIARAPEGFRRMRDRASDAAPAFVQTAERFERDVFPALERAAVERASLQLAWDFTTGSREAPIADMLRVRELTLAWLTSHAPEVHVTEVVQGKSPAARFVRGTLTVPAFVDSVRPGARLVRDAAGAVALGGTTTADFVVVIPASVHDTTTPGRLLGYGHGFFGTLGEVEDTSAATVADTLHAVTFGTRWLGLSGEDLGPLATTLTTDPSRVGDFGDRVHQAMANWIVLTAAMRTSMKGVPEVGAFYDESRIAYFGPSLGHILGGTLAALSTDFSRVVLNVGGAGLTHMMPRAAPFGPLSVLLEQAFDDSLLSEAFIAMMQRPLDRIDPASYAHLVLREPLAGSPPDRRVLIQVGLGDAGVPSVAAFLHARALGLAQTLPASFVVSGLPAMTNETRGAITLFDFGLDLAPMALPSPMPTNEIHEGLRTKPAALRQIDAFLSEAGSLAQSCEGPCNPD